VGSLACGQRVISVANLDQNLQSVHFTSSKGPTRDGRCKPEIAAPGTDRVAANGFGGREQENLWISMTGTSMASPYVAGVIGQMLLLEPNLSAAQIGGIIRRTARPLAGYPYYCEDDAGFGEIMVDACLAEVRDQFGLKETNS
jgi:subtilisin family serine protease